MSLRDYIPAIDELLSDLKSERVFDEKRSAPDSYDTLVGFLEEYLSHEQKSGFEIVNFNPRSLYGAIYEGGQVGVVSEYRHHLPLNNDKESSRLLIATEGLIRGRSNAYPEDRRLSIHQYGIKPLFIELNLHYPFIQDSSIPSTKSSMYYIKLPFEDDAMRECFAYIYSIIKGREITSIMLKNFEEGYKRRFVNRICLALDKGVSLRGKFYRSRTGDYFISEYNKIQAEIFCRFETFLERYLTVRQKKLRREQHEFHYKIFHSLNYQELTGGSRYTDED